MASKGKERENFFRISLLVLDHIKYALVNMLKYYLDDKNKSFEEFIDEHIADIRYLRRSNILNKEEFVQLIVGDKAKSGITVDDLEVMLVRKLLDNLCPNLIMDDGCKTLQDFLKKNQHDIYHLFKFNERCCQCSQDYKFPVTSQLLQEDQYKKMFELLNTQKKNQIKLSPCTNCAGASGMVCSVSSCIVTDVYIRFDYKIRCQMFGHFSPIFKAMQKFTHIRNKSFAHLEAAAIPNECYEVYKKDIEENIMVLARTFGYENETRLALDDVQKCLYDETLDIQNRNRLMKLMERMEELEEKLKTTETNLTKDIADNRQKIDHINDRHIPLHIRKGHIERIKKWRIEDKLFYDETGGFTAALKMVQSENYMTIIGGPGSGKTATAHHIALQLEEQEWEVVPVCRLEEIIQYGDRDHKQVFVLDDVLGIFAVDMNFYNYIINHEENIVTAIGKTSKLLFTCRKSVYKEALKLGLFVTENIVDLQSEDNQLTETEKMAICKYHCKSKGVNPDLYTSLSFTKANHMFPLLCKLFSMEEQYQRLGESFFNKPFDYCIRELDKLKLTNTIQYAVLVLCLVNEGKLSAEALPPKCMQKEVFNDCGVNLGTTEKQIKDAISHMSETYFTKLDTEYTITHDFIYEAIAYHYGGQNQQQILKYVSSSYIANKVTVCEQASNEDLCIQISEDMYLPLAERLYKDIQSMNLFDVFMNNLLKHGPFLDVFERMLKTKPFDEFESLILRKHENIHHFVQKTLSLDEHIQKRTDISELEHLYLLFGMEPSHKSYSNHSVRVISWIINYGHTHLLTEIVNHVKCNNHSISLIFGSNVMENARLLLLGCFSNTLDMVELILEYVDPKCIDMMDYGTSSDIERNFHRWYTPLTTACTKGNLCIMKALLRNNADVNKCNCMKQSPLFVVIKHGHGHVDVVRYLLSSGADVNFRDVYGQSPLFIASQSGHCDIVKYLVAHNADVNLCGKYGHQSPLFIASREGHCDIVKYLVDQNADVNLCNASGQSPLFIASQSGNCDIVKDLVAHNADVNLCDKYHHQSPLVIASKEGHCDNVKYLVDHNADVNLSEVSYGQSPLFIASKEGHCDIVKYLANNTDVNLCEDLYGQSPLFIASKEGHCDIVKDLVAHNADVNLCDQYGHSPLFIASQSGHCDIVKYLVVNNAAVNLCDKHKHSPLSIASQSGHCDIVKDLVAHTAAVNLTDESNRSPLYSAAWMGHYDIVLFLLQNSADVNISDVNNKSPLDVASSSGHYDIVSLLSEHGAGNA